MKGIIELKNRLYYKHANMRNRYPCKIIKIKNHDNFTNKTCITFQAVNKLNIISESIDSILDDPLLVEKFHPNDAIKLGLLAMGQIAFDKCETLGEAQERFLTIVTHMFDEA